MSKNPWLHYCAWYTSYSKILPYVRPICYFWR